MFSPSVLRNVQVGAYNHEGFLSHNNSPTQQVWFDSQSAVIHHHGEWNASEYHGSIQADALFLEASMDVGEIASSRFQVLVVSNASVQAHLVPPKLDEFRQPTCASPY